MKPSRHKETSPPPENVNRGSGSNLHSHDVRDPRSRDRNPTRIFAEEDVRIPGESAPPQNFELSSRQRSGLDTTAQEFVSSVPSSDVIALVSYINRYADQLLRRSVGLDAYLDEAVLALGKPDAARAKSCIEKGMIVDDCANLNSAQMTQYFKLMHDKDTASMKRFKQRYDHYLAHCKARTRSSGTSTAARHTEASSSGQTAKPAKPSRQSSNAENRRLSDEDPGGGTHRWPRLGEDSETLSRAQIIRGPGSAASRDELDPSYRRRRWREAGKFFTAGCVFAILEHKEYTARPEDCKTSSERWLTTSRGVSVFSHIGRFAVVREDHGHSWACPISTYGGQGVAKSGFRPVHVKAHAIIYSGRSAPGPMSTEPTMIKQPIAVDCEDGQELHPASRIDFSRVMTVEHNVRAKSVGRIRSSSMRRFLEYWNNGLMR